MGPQGPLQLLRVWRMGWMPWAPSAAAEGSCLRAAEVLAGVVCLPLSPGCLPISWERLSDPHIKEVRAWEGS